MAEYIERRALFRKLCEFWNIPLDWDGGVNEICEDAFTVIEDFPAADVAPVVHGRWELERQPDGKPYCFHCSVCDGDFHHIGITQKYKYCPNCGARMDLKEGENDGAVD